MKAITLAQKDKELLSFIDAKLQTRKIAGVPYYYTSTGIKRRLYKDKPSKAVVKALSCQHKYN